MTIKTLQDIEQALASGKALFIKFSATWCSPCKALKPKWEEAAQQFAEQANFVEFDVDEDDEALCRFAHQQCANNCCIQNINTAI